MPQFEIVCLANSRKLGGHCVAGLRLDGSGWVRPVGVLPDGILWPADYIMTNGREVKPLDVVRVGVGAHRPALHQPENWVIDGTPWSPRACPWRTAVLPILQKAIIMGPDLLHGLADRVPYAHFEKEPASASLAVVAPDDLYVYPHPTSRGTSQVRGRFSLGAEERLTLYDLPITEPCWQDAIRRHGPRTWRQTQGKFLVTISLSEPFRNDCYKLIAAIMPLPRF